MVYKQQKMFVTRLETGKLKVNVPENSEFVMITLMYIDVIFIRTWANEVPF